MILIIVDVLRLIQFLILVRVVLSWLADPRDPKYRWFNDRIDLMLKPFRVLIPMGNALMDLGPLLALLFFQALTSVVIHFA